MKYKAAANALYKPGKVLLKLILPSLLVIFVVMGNVFGLAGFFGTTKGHYFTGNAKQAATARKKAAVKMDDPILYKVPTVTYHNPPVFTTLQPITPVIPTIANVAAFGYGAPTVLADRGANMEYDVAVDASGTVYAIEDGGIFGIESDGYVFGLSNYFAGYPDIISVAVDGAGNIYFTNQDYSGVYKFSRTDRTITTLGGVFTVRPTKIALDPAGNIYLTDDGDNTVKEIPADGSVTITIAQGFNLPAGIGADAAGNVYVADNENDRIVKIPADHSQPIDLVTGIEGVFDVAVDGNGNLFAASYNSDGSIIEYPAGSGTPVAIGSGFNAPHSIVTDAKGNIFIADTYHGAIKQIKPIGGFFLNNQLPEGLIFNPATGVISGTPAVAGTAKTYTVTAYNGPATKSAAVSLTINPPPAPIVSYTTPVAFMQTNKVTPLAPSTASVNAFGYAKPVPFPLTAGLDFLTVDPAGTIYGTAYTEAITKILPDGTRADISLIHGADDLGGITTDAHGNMYVAHEDNNNTSILKFAAGSNTPVTVAAGLPYLSDLAIDSAGNFYAIADINRKVIKIPAAGGTPVILAPGLDYPFKLAVDGLGNVFIGNKEGAGQDQDVIYKLSATDGSISPVSESIYVELAGLAVDCSGNVFATSGNFLYMITPGAKDPVVISSTLRFPGAIAVSSTGVLYVSDQFFGLYKFQPKGGYFIGRMLPAGLNFDNYTGNISGAPLLSSPATDYTVRAYNFAGGAYCKVNIKVDPFAIDYGPPQSFLTGSSVVLLQPGTGASLLAYSSTVATPVTANVGIFSVAADAAGNILTTMGDSTIRRTPKVGRPVIIGAGSGIIHPYGIALDLSGNIYVSDPGDNTVKELATGSNKAIVLATGFNQPKGITVDVAGNVYVADAGNSTIKKIFANGHAVVPLGSGFSTPYSVALDASGNVFVADFNLSTIKMISAADGSVSNAVIGISQPTGVYIDALDNLFVSCYNTVSVKKYSPTDYYSSSTSIGSGLTHPFGLAVDAAGRVLIADYGTSKVRSITPTNGYFIARPLPKGLKFDSSAGIISGTPTAVSPATDYKITGYYNTASATDTLNLETYALRISYNSPVNLKIGVPATPLMATANPVAPPGYSTTATVIKSGLSQPFGTAIDTAGNIYVADRGANKVYKIPAGGAPMVSIGTGFSLPSGIAVDAAGNVFVADQNHNAIKEILASDGTTVTLGSGFSIPPGVTVDAQGNVYVADKGNGAVKMIPVGGGPVVTLGSGFSSPQSVAVDVYGNVYIAEGAPGNTIKKITPGSGITAILASNLDQPYGLIVDGAGNVFFSDNGNDAIKRIPAVGEGIIPFSAGLNGPNGLAMDGAGNLYVADEFNGELKKMTPTGGFFISPALPQGLRFDWISGTISGTPSTISPAKNYTVTAYNNSGSGSAALNLQVSQNADLTSIRPATGTLSPAFNKDTTSYTVPLPNTTLTASLTPTISDAAATIKVNGIAVASGALSGVFSLNVGDNLVNVVVTARDGITTKTYTVNFKRAESANAVLSSIKITPATGLTVVSGPGYVNYTTSVPNSETSLAVTAIHQEANSTIKINGTTVSSGTASPAIPLNAGDNVINITVTAQDGVTAKTYIITATRAGSSVATLSNLVLSSGTLKPVFATATTDYTAVVPNATSSIKLTPMVTDAAATIKVNGVTVASGAASGSLPLAIGSNAITTVVTAQDGTTTKTYTVTVTRAAAGLSTNALLSSIKISPATGLTVVSGPGYVNYTTSVPGSETSLTVTAIHQDANSTIKVNGAALTSGVASPTIPLNVGDNVIDIVVTAQDGATTKTYIITATRALSPIATLSNIALSTGILSPAFAAGTTNYTAVVPNATSSIKLTPMVTDAAATVKVNGATVASGAATASLPLAVGANIITTAVTAQDGTTTKTYTVTVTRAAAGLSTNALLSSIKISPATGLTVVSGPGYVNYTTAVQNSETSLTVTAVHQDANSTIKTNGASVASGTASPGIPLNVGDNIINIVATAQDGATTKTYIITATRAAAGMAMKYEEPAASLTLSADVTVRQGLSPNGDGENDVLTIDGIANYPDNTLQVMNRSGELVYQVKGYDNGSKAFDGHSSTNGKLQLAGTYFYSLEYKDGNETKHKSGFIVLKY